jgi:hypothetical protein
MNDHQNNAALLAGDEHIVPLVQELLTVATKQANPESALRNAMAQKKLRDLLNPRLKTLDYRGYVVVMPSDLIIACDLDLPIGQKVTDFRREFFDRVLHGKPSVCKPFLSVLVTLADEKGKVRANVPTMFAAAAIRNDNGKPLASLGVRIQPEQGFTRILQLARPGKSGETYAFDKKGQLLSQSRFDKDLKRLGLMPSTADSVSILTVEVRDPQVNMMAGERPSLDRDEQPLTKIVAAAVEGTTGVDVRGYRDYRGVPSVGAWVWLPEYDFGVITEMDLDEAYQPLMIVRRAFWVLMGLLLLSAVIIFVFMLFMSRQERALQEAVLAAKQLGQYALQEKIGSGGMGSVCHAAPAHGHQTAGAGQDFRCGRGAFRA